MNFFLGFSYVYIIYCAEQYDSITITEEQKQESKLARIWDIVYNFEISNVRQSPKFPNFYYKIQKLKEIVKELPNSSIEKQFMNKVNRMFAEYNDMSRYYIKYMLPNAWVLTIIKEVEMKKDTPISVKNMQEIYVAANAIIRVINNRKYISHRFRKLVKNFNFVQYNKAIDNTKLAGFYKLGEQYLYCKIDDYAYLLKKLKSALRYLINTYELKQEKLDRLIIKINL